MPPQHPHRLDRDQDLAERAKEAVIPDLLRPEEAKRSLFVDNNGYRAPETLLGVFNYQPAFEPFTLEEELIFAEAFRDTPKDFHAVASVLPGRSSEECLQHYYANKADGRFKTETRRHRERERESLKDQYDLPETPPDSKQKVIKRKCNSLDVVPITAEIKSLKKKLGKKGKSLQVRGPETDMETAVLPRPDMATLRYGFQPPLDLSDEKLSRWIRSANVLPLVKQWKEECLDKSELYVQMQQVLKEMDRPWGTISDKMADYAVFYGEKEFPIEHKIKNEKAIVLCTNFAAKIANSNAELFDQSKAYGFPKMDRMRACVCVLITAYDDLRRNRNGFFRTLLDSELTGPLSMSARQSWEEKYRFQGEDEAEREHHERLLVERAPVGPDYLIGSSRFPSTRSQHRAAKPQIEQGTMARDSTVEEVDDHNSEFEAERDRAGQDTGGMRKFMDEELAKTKAALTGMTKHRDELLMKVEEQEAIIRSAGASTPAAEMESDNSSDGISADGEFAMDGFRAKADGSELAVRTIRSKFQESEKARNFIESALVQERKHRERLEERVKTLVQENERLYGRQTSHALQDPEPVEMSANAKQIASDFESETYQKQEDDQVV